MEKRSDDINMHIYGRAARYMINQLQGIKFEPQQIKTSIVGRKLRGSIYGCSLAVFESLDNRFIWWELGLKEEMLELLNAAYFTGNPVIIHYVDIKEEILKLKEKIPNFEKSRGEDLLAIKVTIEKYK